MFSQLYGISIFTYKQSYDIPKYITDLQIICVSIKKWLFANENLYRYIYLDPFHILLRKGVMRTTYNLVESLTWWSASPFKVACLALASFYSALESQKMWEIWKCNRNRLLYLALIQIQMYHSLFSKSSFKRCHLEVQPDYFTWFINLILKNSSFLRY